jgi:predicted ATP-dependent endonuclease of OLD family
MKLTKIEIENFRSIKSQTIIIDHNCLVLLGKNEAGKSNILKAIAAIFNKYKVTNKDKRKKLGNETIDNYFIRAIIELSKEDYTEILNRFAKLYTNTEYVKFKYENTLLKYIECYFYNLLIRINIADNENPYYSWWSYTGKIKFELENGLYLDKTYFNTEEIGKKQEIEDIRSIIFDIIIKMYNEMPYICHFWQYENSILLPNSVNILNFTVNPKQFPSLYNIFQTCNRFDIKKEFDDAISQDGDYSNLLDQVSKTITKIFREIWKDLNDTSIELMAGESEMIIKVSNKTKYSFEDRSDGFKKFISILLMLSTRVRSKQLGERDIILIDEPDQSLYPTSAEYLRDELIKISETTRVIYATHSQDMIDSNCIERHLVIEKNDDITSINIQDKNSPFSEDELLRRAIGSSIFNIIKPKNIIFEGWLDKELFRKYCDYNEKSKDFNQAGIVYLGGISGVETLVQLLILANKKFIIVADSDTVSKSKREDFEEHYEEFASSWLSYNDVVGGIQTMEDFLSIEWITKNLQKECPDFVYDTSKKAVENIESVVNNFKEKKQQIKKDIINKLRKEDINNDYSVFVEQLNIKLKES